MKKTLLLLLIAALFAACNSNKSKKVSNIVTVSILPQKTFVQKIAGDDFEVNVLVPRGSSPAAYSLLPSQLKAIAGSAVWFRIGYIGFEYSWAEKIMEANGDMKVVDLSKGLDLIVDEEEQHGDHVHMNGVDPHIWLSPLLVKQMAQKILDELSVLKPEKSVEYKGNYLKFVKEIDQLNIEIKNKLKSFQGKKFIVFHPSLTYFARDYGLEQFSLETGGKEPTPKQLASVVDLAKAENIKVIYIQDEFDREHARVFAEEIGGEIIQLRPLDAVWVDNLKEITNIFTDNF
ncbi:MAG: zinc ABC transporter substrate-binding protein [Bacteroidetes bacterium]|nr:zinc ABC transporter substrate-binding protein [Bacteroidota bacterium]